MPRRRLLQWNFSVAIVLTFLRLTSQSVQPKCFCQLDFDSKVDECACEISTVDKFNSMEVYPRVSALLEEDYFKFWRVDLSKKCPFWKDEGQCTFKDCSLHECPIESVPAGLKPNLSKDRLDPAQKYTREAQGDKSCADSQTRSGSEGISSDADLGSVDPRISESSKESFIAWHEHDEANEEFCLRDDEQSGDAQYYDLTRNPERFTGYQGPSANRVWSAIYKENCFKPNSEQNQYMNNHILPNECLEKRVFFRSISGLHTSITVHLCGHWFYPNSNVMLPSSGRWGCNFEEFQKRFDPALTNQEGPLRLKNLYFIYLLELRALAKARPYFIDETFYTGSAESDPKVRKDVAELLNVISRFSQHFNESQLFRGDPAQARVLREEFRQHFFNISRIMDCVGCDKCRLWGKLQVKGLGTALKILFSGKAIGKESTIDARNKQEFFLDRGEIVALFNAFGRLSSSIRFLDRFRREGT